MRDSDPKIETQTQSNLKRYGMYALILLIVFLLGLVPMWLQKREISRQLDATQNELQRSEINNLLTTAIVEARRGEYESARKNTSDFFTRLDAEIKEGETSAYSKEEQAKLNAVFTNRDALITMLAQRDQASTERLNDVYTNFQTALGAPQAATVPPSETSSPAVAAPTR